jgi:hypothetical protein
LSCGKPIIPQSATFDPEFLPLLALYQKILNDFAGLPKNVDSFFFMGQERPGKFLK